MGTCGPKRVLAKKTGWKPCFAKSAASPLSNISIFFSSPLLTVALVGAQLEDPLLVASQLFCKLEWGQASGTPPSESFGVREGRVGRGQVEHGAPALRNADLEQARLSSVFDACEVGERERAG